MKMILRSMQMNPNLTPGPQTRPTAVSSTPNHHMQTQKQTRTLLVKPTLLPIQGGKPFTTSHCADFCNFCKSPNGNVIESEYVLANLPQIHSEKLRNPTPGIPHGDVVETPLCMTTREGEEVPVCLALGRVGARRVFIDAGLLAAVDLGGHRHGGPIPWPRNGHARHPSSQRRWQQCGSRFVQHGSLFSLCLSPSL